MSLQMMKACFLLELPMAAKSVLNVMAYCSDGNGFCWPSIPKIASMSGVSDRSVSRAIKALEESGVLIANRGNGRKTSYKISPEKFNGKRFDVVKTCSIESENPCQIDSQPMTQWQRTTDKVAGVHVPVTHDRVTPTHDTLTFDPRHSDSEPLTEWHTNSNERMFNVKTKDKHNNISDLEKKGEQEKKDVVVNPNLMSNRTPTQTRAVEIAVMLRQSGAAVQANSPYLLEWAEQGISDAQLLTALEQAKSQRHEQNNPSPVNAGYINAILRNAIKNQFGRARTKSGYKSVHERREATARMLYGSLQSMTQPREVLDDGRTIEHE